MSFEIIFSIRNLWLGVYWEIWKQPWRLDIWFAPLPFVSLHFWLTKNMSERIISLVMDHCKNPENYRFAVGWKTPFKWHCNKMMIRVIRYRKVIKNGYCDKCREEKWIKDRVYWICQCEHCNLVW